MDLHGLFPILAPLLPSNHMSEDNYNFSPESIKRSHDFGTASKAIALIRKTFQPRTKEFWDETFLKRLRQLAIKIINTGPVASKGNLQFTDGDISMLKIEFNSTRALSSLFEVRPELRFNNTDYLIISLPQLNPKELCKYPKRATSIVVRFVCGIFHFDLQKAGQTSSRDLEMPVGDYIFPGGKLRIPLQAAENSVVSVAMCVWYKSGGAKIKLSRYNCGGIIRSFNIVDGKITSFISTPKPQKPPLPPEQQLDWELDGE